MKINPQTLPEHIRKLQNAETLRLLGCPNSSSFATALASEPSKATLISEKELQYRCGCLLAHRGIVWNRSRMDRKSTMREGWPDFTFALRGQACAVEFKIGDAQLTAEQQQVRDQMLADGWWYSVCRNEQEFHEKLTEWTEKQAQTNKLLAIFNGATPLTPNTYKQS